MNFITHMNNKITDRMYESVRDKDTYTETIYNLLWWSSFKIEFFKLNHNSLIGQTSKQIKTNFTSFFKYVLSSKSRYPTIVWRKII